MLPSEKSERAYLEHFLDSIWLLRGVLICVGTEDQVGIGVLLSIFSDIVPQFFEDSLGDVGVEVVDEYALGHLKI